ncbi:MAG: methylmalonyl-CoA mutase family protein [Candidatus Neomarinimicrobiota bacterium]|nr:methylmalonyl-CoA mutase family protein [Candidatus Neomarinimicrobiota bacterium]
MSEKPGKFPFTRGIYSEMYKKRLWSMRQYAGFSSAEESNKRFKYLLDQGVTGLSVAFDLPTQIGYDSDHELAKGEVGKVGVPISTIEDMNILFDNIKLDAVSTSMTINATAPILYALYIVAAENQGVSANKLTGTIQNDILKEYIARGTYIFPPQPSMRLATDILEFSNTHTPKWNPISISGYHIREAGSTATQELAFTIANGITYVSDAIKRGLDPDKFASRISFFFNAHNDLLVEVAKFRAARRMWAKIMKSKFNVTNEKALKCRFHVQTGGSTLSAQEIDNNIVRTTIQALSAILGGAQSLHTNSRDEALSLPTDESAKLALRTQQIIAYESGITNHPDPFGGSYVIEKMTDTIEKDAYDIIKIIENMGGVIEGIESGWIQNEISQSASKYQSSIDAKDKIIVGVNEYKSDNKDNYKPMEMDDSLVAIQLKRLKDFKKSRDNLLVKDKLHYLNSIAQDSQNIIPAIIECVRSNCTIGEISDQLRNIFGEHQSNI